MNQSFEQTDILNESQETAICEIRKSFQQQNQNILSTNRSTVSIPSKNRPRTSEPDQTTAMKSKVAVRVERRLMALAANKHIGGKEEKHQLKAEDRRAPTG